MASLAGSELFNGDLNAYSNVTYEEARRLFSEALESYLSLRLKGLIVAAGPRGEEVADVIANMAPHLSSSGYKLVRATDDLSVLALPGLESLALEKDDVSSAAAIARGRTIDGLPVSLAVDSVLDELKNEATGAGVRRSSKVIAELHTALEKADEKPARMASGRLLGKTTSRILAESLVNYELALKWLAESSVVRMRRSLSGDRVVALIHDGFGPAMIAWGTERLRSPDCAIRSLTAIAGASPFDEEQPPEFGNIDGEVLSIRDVRWLGCYIKANFRNVSFEGCDFSGTGFNECTFENVQFLNCTTWGCIFADCKVVGNGGLRFIGNVNDSSTEVRTLSFVRLEIDGSAFDQNTAFASAGRSGLQFRDLAGYGLFLDGATGGPWAIDHCGLEHVSFRSNQWERQGQCGPGFILGGSRITHITLPESRVEEGEVSQGVPRQDIVLKDSGSEVAFLWDRTEEDALRDR